MDGKNRKRKTVPEFDAEKNGSKPLDGSLGAAIREMRGLGLFDGVEDPYAELMRERGAEVRR